MKLQQTCALTLGILFLILGIAGFIPAFTTIPGETFDSGIPLDADSLYAKGFSLLLGVFPTNLIHNLFHVFVGILGIATSKTGNGRLFNQIFGISYIAIVIMGTLPIAKTVFGIMPIFGNNIWWNGLTGAIAAYYGFFAKNPTASTEQFNA
ncbi:MAG: DUF4383 domain-containing protein [Cyanobacteria bacterium J06607_15]